MTAKEVLLDQKLRREFDSEYNARRQLEEERQKEQLRRHQMGRVRREQIERLEAMEKRASDQRRAAVSKQRAFNSKRDAVKEELDRFRTMIQEQRQQAMDRERAQQKRTVHEQFERERAQRRTLTVRMDRKRCGNQRPYTQQELESIFKVYGKTSEIVTARDGAEIRFKKSKGRRRAIEDAKTLRKEFYLLIVGAHTVGKRKAVDDAERERQSAARWSKFVRRRRDIPYSQKTEMVWKEVQQFVARTAAADTQ